MNKILQTTGLSLLMAAGTNAMAQSALNISIGAMVPIGPFRETVHPLPTESDPRRVEGYDVGVGGWLNWNLALAGPLASRMGLFWTGTEGTCKADGYGTVKVEREMTSFTVGLALYYPSAAKPNGFYVHGNASADFDHTTMTYRPPDDFWANIFQHDVTELNRRSRFGGMAGFGYVWDAGIRFTLEVGWHRTLTGSRKGEWEHPPTDFVVVSAGFML